MLCTLIALVRFSPCAEQYQGCYGAKGEDGSDSQPLDFVQSGQSCTNIQLTFPNPPDPDNSCGDDNGNEGDDQGEGEEEDKNKEGKKEGEEGNEEKEREEDEKEEEGKDEEKEHEDKEGKDEGGGDDDDGGDSDYNATSLAVKMYVPSGVSNIAYDAAVAQRQGYYTDGRYLTHSFSGMTTENVAGTAAAHGEGGPHLPDFGSKTLGNIEKLVDSFLGSAEDRIHTLVRAAPIFKPNIQSPTLWV